MPPSSPHISSSIFLTFAHQMMKSAPGVSSVVEHRRFVRYSECLSRFELCYGMQLDLIVRAVQVQFTCCGRFCFSRSTPQSTSIIKSREQTEGISQVVLDVCPSHCKLAGGKLSLF